MDDDNLPEDDLPQNNFSENNSSEKASSKNKYSKISQSEVNVNGLLLDEKNVLTLADLSRACTVHAEWVIELVDEGIIEPHSYDAPQWFFSGDSLERARIVRRLQRDLGINIAGAALVLNLKDEIEILRGRIYALEGK